MNAYVSVCKIMYDASVMNYHERV